MDNRDIIRNAFKSLEDLKVVIEPVKKPIFEDIEAEPAEGASDADKTVKDLFDEAGSYILTHEFDNNGTTFYLFMEGLNNGESCDILFDEYDVNNIESVLVEILDSEHDFIDSLHMEGVNLDSMVSSVVDAANGQLNGTEGVETEPESSDTDPEDHDTNVRDFVGDGPDADEQESEVEPEDKGETLPPVEAEINPADIKDAPAEEPQEESLNTDKKFIKTRNSKADATDLAAELDANDIEYEMADDGLYVSAKDFDRAQSMLDQLEMDDADESLEEEAKFNLQDDEEVKEAEAILDKDEGDTIEQIVDVNADTVDDLQQSYIGSIALRCPTCRTLIYKSRDQLVKSEGESDDDEVLYNVDEECPHCGAKDGFELIGMLASLDVDPFAEPSVPSEKQPEEPKEPEHKEEEKPEEKPEPSEPMPTLPHEDKKEEDLEEDTVKQGDKWVNKGDAGTHGEFKTKKAADAQRKAMFANGYKESLGEDVKPVAQEPCTKIELTTDEKNMLDKLTRKNKMDAWFAFGDDDETIIDLEDNNKPMDTCEAILMIDDGTEDVESFLTSEEADLFNGLVARCKECEAARHAVKECNQTDVQLEEIDSNRYDKLINRYLKENYANVKSYVTTDAKLDDEHNKAILEGTITFKSGAEKKTKFVFEAREITKKGQLKLIGSNKTFTESAKAFTLLGKVRDKRLISESLSYSYKAGDTKVKGKIEPLRKR